MSHTLNGLNSGNCSTPEMRDAIRRAMAEVLAGTPEDVLADAKNNDGAPLSMEDAIRRALADVVCTGPERVLADLDGQLLAEA